MKTSLKSGIAALVASVVMLSAPAFADPILGVWKTEPDRKNLTSHIAVQQCGAKICGKVLRAFDASGREVKTKNVGRTLFWDMSAKGGGLYDGGTFDIPFLNVKVRAKMAMKGNTLTVRGCKAGVCDGQTWKRVS